MKSNFIDLVGWEGRGGGGGSMHRYVLCCVGQSLKLSQICLYVSAAPCVIAPDHCIFFALPFKLSTF